MLYKAQHLMPPNWDRKEVIRFASQKRMGARTRLQMQNLGQGTNMKQRAWNKEQGTLLPSCNRH